MGLLGWSLGKVDWHLCLGNQLLPGCSFRIPFLHGKGGKQGRRDQEHQVQANFNWPKVLWAALPVVPPLCLCKLSSGFSGTLGDKAVWRCLSGHSSGSHWSLQCGSWGVMGLVFLPGYHSRGLQWTALAERDLPSTALLPKWPQCRAG